MLSGLLERHQCAECRFCCVFDAQDVWEAPSLSEAAAAEVLRLKPDTLLNPVGGAYVFDPRNAEQGLYPCPALSRDGCTLPADLKPLECSLWPFRVMSLDGSLVLAVCTDCKALEGVPTATVDAFAEARVRGVAFEYAERYPHTVKPYHGNYRIVG